VESASNVEIRCEVQAQGSGGTTILEIIPEGTYVQPGDLLVRLDSSALEDDETKQQITCANSEAVRIQAENDLASAEIALREYLEGQYVQNKQKLESDLFVARENLSRAIEYADYSEKLAAKGYVTQVQLQADKFAVEKAMKDKEAAETALKVLDQFTKEKMVKQLEADIKTCQAKLEAAEHSHKLDLEKLELIQSQIKKCVIKAPEAGQVVYASQRDSRGSNEIIIEEGATVRERQVIIRLPDPKRMQVKAKINEAKIALVAVGMPATLRLDAYQGMVLRGTVEKVNEYPAPTSWFNTNVKEYETIVHIDSPPAGLRPGLTAQVKIRVNRLTGVLQVPVQAIFEHGGKHYAVLRDGVGWRAQPVEIGITNDKFVVIEDGLSEGQQVVLNAIAYRDKVDLPELPLEVKDKELAGKSQSDEPQPSPSAEGGGAGGRPRERSDRERAGGREEASGPGGRGGFDPGALVGRFDSNGDGKLQADELPEQMRSRLSEADKNGDGAIDVGEFTAAMRAMGGGGRRGRQPGGQP
jgi:multidrug efflux pump subunit AcrA (membrane-fusion protein)